MAVDVGDGASDDVSEGVGVRLGIEVFDGVGVTVGVDVIVGVGVRVSGRNGVAVGANVGVALGSGEGSAGAPDESGCPAGAKLWSVDVLGSNEAIGPNILESNMLERAAAFDDKVAIAKTNPPITSSSAKPISTARFSVNLRLCFFESI